MNQGLALLVGAQAYVGSAAGVATSILWTGTSLLFTAAGKRLGPTVLNASRIALALVLLAVTHRLLAGRWFPNVRAEQALYLGASGIVGLVIGDQAIFTAFLDLGTRRALLVQTTAPLFAALFGWWVLGEVIGSTAWVGIALTLGGVAWVILERPALSAEPVPTRRLVRGLACASLASLCQAGGLLLSKRGMGHGWLPASEHLDPQAATLVRMVFAAAGMVPIVLLHAYRRRRRPVDLTVRRDPSSRTAGYVFAACGAVLGPFLGVWMSLVASDRAPLGIAQTLCSLSPVFILPFVATIQKETVSVRATIGALVSVAGSAVIFWRSA